MNSVIASRLVPALLCPNELLFAPYYLMSRSLPSITPRKELKASLGCIFARYVYLIEVGRLFLRVGKWTMC